MRLRLFLLTIAICGQLPFLSAGHFAYNTKARTIYKKIFELRLDEAQTLCSALRQSEPDNLVVHHLENYIDFFTIYVSEDERVYQRLRSRRDTRLSAVAKGDDNSPYRLFIQAEIRLHWALLKLRFEDYLSAFTDINRAHRLLLTNQERFPNFLANQKDLGILHAAVGTVPDSYRWALELISSLEGTVAQGKREVESVLRKADEDFPFLQETQVLYTFLLLHLDGRPEAAWSALQRIGLQPSQSPLHAFVKANVAMRTGRNDLASRWLHQAPRGAEFLAFPYLDYMLGMSKLRKLDTAAKSNFEAFLRHTKGRHYIKEAHQKLAWAALLAGDQSGYRRQMQLVLQNGTDAAGGDSNAQREAERGQIPDRSLLGARLLYDGGYYEQALSDLQTKTISDFSSTAFQLEYAYRKGRILQGLKRYEEALTQFDQTITKGENNPAFFACNAALQAGMIQEKRGQKTSARAYYRKCLGLHPDEYKTGLHQQAKAGLSRVGR